MGAFQAGFQLGQSAFNQAERNRLLQVQEERAAEEFARKKQDWQKADELEAQVKGLSEQITNPNASNYRMGGSPVGLKMPGQAAQADAAPGEMPPTDFSFGPAAAGGLKAPKAFALADTPGAAVAPAPDAVGLRGSVLPAGGVSLKAGPSASEEQAILAKIALLKGDIQGFNSARDRGKVESRKAELRDFTNQGVKLFNARNESPEAMEAWVQFVSPYTSMISKYKGAEFDARVNPKTGQLEVIPYEGGKVQAVSLDEAMPYLQAAFQKTSEYGDPEAAVKALNDIAAAERTKSRDDSSFRLGVADKVGASVARARTGDQQDEKLRIERAGAGAKNGYYAAQAALANERLRDYRDERDRRGQAAELVGKFESLSPADQAGPVGQGLIRQFNMLNVKHGGQVSMGGAGANKPRPDLKFQANGDSGFFTDSNGYPVGRQDPTMGLVPFGVDPRGDTALVAKLDSKGVKVVSVEGPGGRPVWGYASTDGRVFSTPEEALSPPKTPLDSGRVGALSSFRDELGAAQQQLVAAGKSGDPQAIAHWSQKVMGLKRMHQDAAKSLFGTRADEYLSAN